MSIILKATELPESYKGLVSEESAYIEGLYEAIFNHKALPAAREPFGYEGLGSIYWHMVSKLS